MVGDLFQGLDKHNGEVTKVISLCLYNMPPELECQPEVSNFVEIASWFFLLTVFEMCALSDTLNKKISPGFCVVIRTAGRRLYRPYSRGIGHLPRW